MWSSTTQGLKGKLKSQALRLGLSIFKCVMLLLGTPRLRRAEVLLLASRLEAVPLAASRVSGLEQLQGRDKP